MTEVSKPINLAGQTAVVTGGARGIGACIARTLAREGADVVVCDIVSPEETVQQIQQTGRQALGLTCDVTKPDEVRRVVEAAVSAFRKVDILVANAGIVQRVPFADLTLEQWQRHMDVNATGTFLTVQAVYPEMVKNRSGKIVCIGSIAAHMGGVNASPDYAASKGSVHSFVKALSREAAAQGIYVNGVAPGPIETEMTSGIDFNAKESFPLRRMGRPEDIAEAVLFLASSASNYITGTILDVNGGVYLR